MWERKPLGLSGVEDVTADSHRAAQARVSTAALSHGLGIPAVDSLILAGFLAEKVRTIYTTDVHFESYRKKGIKVINLKPGS